MPDLTVKFQPHQVGFGSKGGCEAAVHAARTFLSDGRDEVFLKVDVKNAFNSINRETLLQQVKDNAPSIYNYIWQCYKTPSALIYRDNLILSAVGCQQGDPLGPAIFSLAIHPVISKLKSKLNVWYLDDGTLGGDAISVLEDLDFLISEFKNIGLDLNFSKCELYLSDTITPSDKANLLTKFNNLAPNIKILSRESLYLLGAPISELSIPSFVKKITANFLESSFRLSKINSHMALTIIRHCLFVPKFTFYLRSTPIWMYSNLMQNLDDLIRKTLSEILNCTFDDRSWTQATLPIRFGGLGIRKISSVALPAFLSSVHSTHDLFGNIISPSLGDIEVAHLADAKKAWEMACPGQNFPLNSKSQKLWDEPICRDVHKHLIDTASSPADRARLLAVSTHESGYWLHAIPSATFGTLFDRNTLTLAACLRLGIKTNEPHRCQCGEKVDVLGHHGLSCQRSAGRFSRHAAINDIIRRALVTVNVPAILEPNGISRDDGKRPDGMTLIAWKSGKTLVWDATCVDTVAPCHIKATSSKAGAAALHAENSKRRKYSSLNISYEFVPFGVETLGPWGPGAKKLFQEIATRLIEASGDPRAGFYLGQKISSAIQKGNAASILGTLPTCTGSDLTHFLHL